VEGFCFQVVHSRTMKIVINTNLLFFFFLALSSRHYFSKLALSKMKCNVKLLMNVTQRKL
jgi:hypothetical protein